MHVHEKEGGGPMLTVREFFLQSKFTIIAINPFRKKSYSELKFEISVQKMFQAF